MISLSQISLYSACIAAFSSCAVVTFAQDTDNQASKVDGQDSLRSSGTVVAFGDSLSDNGTGCAVLSLPFDSGMPSLHWQALAHGLCPTMHGQAITHILVIDFQTAQYGLNTLRTDSE
jgi:hypothetical protein